MLKVHRKEKDQETETPDSGKGAEMGFAGGSRWGGKLHKPCCGNAAASSYPQ